MYKVNQNSEYSSLVAKRRVNCTCALSSASLLLGDIVMCH